jgi:hypothetical protein
MTIFISNVLYYAITCLVGNNILIHCVLTFNQILAPLAPMILTNFVNSKCVLRLLQKYLYNVNGKP